MSRSATLAVGLSVDEFLVYDTPDGKAELVRGELRMTPSPGAAHGHVITQLLVRLAAFVDANGLGRVLANVGFELVQLPRTVRAPDLAFIRADRLPPSGLGDGPMRMVPDLAVEVVSPSETSDRLGEKLDDYRACAVPMVWLVDPRKRVITVIDGSRPAQVLGEGDRLTGGSVIPGFSCKIRDLFKGLSTSIAPSA